jgi:uncharacterized membrane protein
MSRRRRKPRRHPHLLAAVSLLIFLAFFPMNVQARSIYNKFGPELFWIWSILGGLFAGFYLFRHKPLLIRVLASSAISGLALWIFPVPSWMPIAVPPLMFFVLMSREWENMVHGGRAPKMARRNDGELRNSTSLADMHQTETKSPTTREQTLLRVLRHSLIAPWISRAWRSNRLHAAIRDRIAASERSHLGEIVVAIETRWSTDDIRRDMTSAQHARNRFSELGVWATESNNGVLLHITLAEKAIDIVADRGIAERVDAATWQAIADDLAAQCKRGAIQTGLIAAIDHIGEILHAHFPNSASDKNPDERSNTPVLT